MKRRAAGKTKKNTGRGQGGRSKGEGKGPADNGELRVDGEGRWQRVKLYTHNDPAALCRADKDLLLQWLPYLPLEDSTLQSKLPGVLEWLRLKDYISSYNNNKLLITLGRGNTHQVIRLDLNQEMLMAMPPRTKGFCRLEILGYAICRVNEPNAQELLNDYIIRVRASAMVNAYRRMDTAMPHRWRKGLNVNVDAVFQRAGMSHTTVWPARTDMATAHAVCIQ